MLSFKENNCRLCTKVFCCKKCREKHELNLHDVFPECEICVYGKTVLKIPTDDLLQHIKDKHWPLHCVDCNRIFGDIQELILHNKCPLAKIDMSAINSPIEVKENAFNYESPLVRNTNVTPSSNELFVVIPKIIHLTTSTPRTYNNESLNVFVVTPNDTENKLENYAEITDNTQEETKNQQSKRRVTFNESPIYDSLKKTPQENKLLKSSLKKTEKTRRYDHSEENPANYSELDPLKQKPTPILSNSSVWLTACIETPQNKLHESSDSSSSSSYNSCVSKGEIENIDKRAEDQTVNFSTPRQNVKRPRDLEDINDSFIRLKRIKLTDIQCRRPINDTIPYRFCIRRQKRYCDKATQTD